MLECLILGDSIAVGTHQFRKECVAYAKGGWNTWQWNRDYLKNDLSAKTVIISLGTNDHNGVNTLKELTKMRDKVKADRVFWILPPCNDKFCKPRVNDFVRAVAASYNDQIIETKQLQTDNIHPSWAGYKEIGEKTK